MFYTHDILIFKENMENKFRKRNNLEVLGGEHENRITT